MTGDNLNEYLALFETLGNRTELNPDDPSNLRTFAQGLPHQLADACLAMENPDTYEQWKAAAQRQQVIYLKKKALHSEYGTRNPTRSAGQNSQQKQNTGWVWRQPGGKSNPNNQNWRGQGNRIQPPRPHLPLKTTMQWMSPWFERPPPTKKKRNIAVLVDAFNVENKVILCKTVPVN